MEKILENQVNPTTEEVSKEMNMNNAKSVLTVCLSPTFQNTLMFDNFKQSQVNRAVCPMLISPSGKGINVTRALTQLGRPSECLTQLGGPRLQEFLDLCAEERIKMQPVVCNSPIRTCTTIINRLQIQGQIKSTNLNTSRSTNPTLTPVYSDGLTTSTELVENAHAVDANTDHQVRQRFLAAIQGKAALVISGTKAPGFGSDLYPWMVSHARQQGLLVVLDIKGNDLRECLPSHPDVIKPNLDEFIDTFFQCKEIPESEASENLRDHVQLKTAELFRQFGVRTVLTRGQYDTWAFDGETLLTVPVPSVSAVNTIGCGDCMTAGLTDALLAGKSFYDSISFGTQCASRRATHIQHGL